MTTIREHALFYASNGWRVFPLIAKEKVPACKWADVATTEVNMINGWWEHDPNQNVGIATGSKSGILVLDIDTGHGGEETLSQLESKYGKLPATPICRTGGGGRHFFFKYADGTKNTASKIGAGIDTRSEGGYVVGANSLHPNGNHYEWDREHLPSQTKLATAPDWMLKILVDDRQPQQIAQTADGAYISGQRNVALTSLAGAMRRKNMTEESIFLAINAENLNRCIPPLPEQEVRLIAASVSRYQAQDAMPLVNRDRVQAEWSFVKCTYEFPESIVSYQDLLTSDFGQPQLRDYWQSINSGIDVTEAAANVGILAEIEKYQDFDSLRQEGYAKQIKHYGYHAAILKHAETLKVHSLAGNTQGVDKALMEINKIPAQVANRIVSIGDVADEVEELIIERQKNPTDVWGIPYAWDYISHVTGGKQKGELILDAAEPGVGKSWWWLQDALYTAIAETPVKYWSGEMPRNQLMMRLYQLLGVNGYNMKSGYMTHEDWDKLYDAKALIMNSPLFLDDHPLALHEIRPMLIKEIAEHGIQQAIFDYESLIFAPGKDEIEQSANTSRALKIMAQDLNISIVLISSVNKSGMDQSAEYASKSNVRGSGQKLHDADIIYMMAKFDNSKGIEYKINLQDYDKTVMKYIKKGRELVGVENGFVIYQREGDSPKFKEVLNLKQQSKIRK